MTKKPRRKNLKPPGKCIFCGGGNLSKEHFWPEWASALLPHYPINQHVEQLFTFTEVTKLNGPPEVRSKPGNLWTKKIRVVCGACNNGWMSILETDVQPILTPLIITQPHTLTDNSMEILAKWIALKIMVGEHNNPKDAVTPVEAREKFKSTQEIPPNFNIWIAKCGVGGWQTAYVRHTATVSLTPVFKPNHQFKNTHSVTFGIGDLFVLVLHSTVKDLDLNLTFEPSGEGVIFPLFPIIGSINWPPIRNLSATEAHSMAWTLKRWLIGHKKRWLPSPSCAE
jgi:hypothetical protein